MIRVGLRLTFTGDKESLVRLIVTSIAVALGVGLLLASLASINAVNSQSARGSWLNTQPGGSSAMSTNSHTNPLWWLASSDEFEGLRSTVSTWKKSVATIPDAWARRNWRQ